MRRRDLMTIAATQQVREMQEGAKLGYNESSFAPATTCFVSSNIPIGTADFSVEYYGNFVGAANAGINTLFNASGSNTYAKGCFIVCGSTATIDKNYISWILFEGSADADGLYLNYTHANTLPFHLVITRQGATTKAYINGVLKGTKVQSSVKDFPQFKLGLANSSDCRFSRIFNYALVAQQVTALYNNGKPEEYLLTAAEKNPFYKTFSVKKWDYTNSGILTENNGAFTYHCSNCYGFNGLSINRKMEVGASYKTTFDCSSDDNFANLNKISHPNDGFANTNINYITNADGSRTYTVYQLNCRLAIDSYVLCIGGSSINGKTLNFTISNISFTKVGCIAEYLPQNLVTAHDGDMTDKTPIAWLDSAKQIPLNDEYLPPLLQGIGGYDLTALGTPEIVEKAR
ncbi:MAG: hypothetical protein RR410_07260 [Alistipes sp.]